MKRGQFLATVLAPIAAIFIPKKEFIQPIKNLDILKTGEFFPALPFKHYAIFIPRSSNDPRSVEVINGKDGKIEYSVKTEGGEYLTDNKETSDYYFKRQPENWSVTK